MHNGKKEFEYNKLNMYSLRVYDRVAVQVKSNGDLHFYENGFDRGIAMRDMPIQKELFAVFDLYGQTKQVSWDYFGGKFIIRFIIMYHHSYHLLVSIYHHYCHPHHDYHLLSYCILSCIPAAGLLIKFPYVLWDYQRDRIIREVGLSFQGSF